jgi:PST family polysaccharide transporter
VAKFGLFFASLALLSLLIFSFDLFRQNWGIYYLSFGLVLGQTLFPVWLFQGMERMKYIAYPNMWAKLAIAIFIFALVREKEDYWMVPALFSSGYIAVGFYALYIAKKKMGVRFSWPPMGAVGAQLKDGYHVFLSGLATNVYTVSSTFILGLFTNNLVVGHFAAAEKLIQAINGLYLPVSQALYPFLNKKIENDRQAGLAFVRKVAGLVGGGMTLISALLFIFAPVIVRVMFGAGFEESVLLLRILAVVPVFVALGNVLGIHIMLNIGFKRAYSTILLFAAMLAIG